MITDKKALANWKRKFELHTQLIMQATGCTKTVAQVNAYHEGGDLMVQYLAPKVEQKK